LRGAGGKHVEAGARTPHFFDFIEGERHGPERKSPRLIVVTELASEGVEQNQRRSLGRVRRGEEHRHLSAVREPEQRGAPRARRLHHRAHVVAPLLESRQRRERHGIGHSGSAFVEAEKPTEACEAIQEARHRGLFPHDLHVGGPPRNEDEIARAIADDLIGDVSFLAPRVSRLRDDHRGGFQS